MHKIAVLVLIFWGLVKVGTADTISYWHVSYNNRLIQQFSLISQEPKLSLKISEIKSLDSLTTQFTDDTPCEDCQVNLLIEDNEGNLVKQIKNYGSFSRLTFPLIDLILYRTKSENQYFEFYYYEDKIENRVHLFRLILF